MCCWKGDKVDRGKNVIQLDFFFTYTGEEQRLDERPPDKVAERSDQFSTRLIMTSIRNTGNTRCTSSIEGNTDSQFENSRARGHQIFPGEFGSRSLYIPRRLRTGYETDFEVSATSESSDGTCM